MTSKLKKTKADHPADIVSAVSASAQQIWQAGLGAFAAARDDGGKLFEALVRDGQQLHQLTEAFSRNWVPDVAGGFGKLADDVGRQAGASLDRIEQFVEERVARSLHRIGVPTSAEVDALRRDIAALTAAMGQPAAKRGNGAAPRKADGAARKVAAKRAPPKPAAAPAKRAARATAARARP